MKKNKIILCMLLMLVIASSSFACDKKVYKSNSTDAPTATPKAETPNPTNIPEPTVGPTVAPGINVAFEKYYECSSEAPGGFVQWGWSSTYINDGVIENLGNEHIGWTTNTKTILTMEEWEDQWVMIDMGSNIRIDKVVIYPRQDNGLYFPVDYEIQISNDYKTFTTIATVKDDNRSVNGDITPSVVTFDPVETRYVQLLITKPYEVPAGNDGFLVQLAEFEIYSASIN